MTIVYFQKNIMFLISSHFTYICLSAPLSVLLVNYIVTVNKLTGMATLKGCKMRDYQN